MIYEIGDIDDATLDCSRCDPEVKDRGKIQQLYL